MSLAKIERMILTIVGHKDRETGGRTRGQEELLQLSLTNDIDKPVLERLIWWGAMKKRLEHNTDR